MNEYDDDVESEAIDDSSYDGEELESMLSGLVEADEDLSERKRRQRQQRRSQKQPVRTARGGSAYRNPTPEGPVTQKQLKDALARVGEDVRRNAQGIKTINGQLGATTKRIDDVVTVNQIQSKALGKLERSMKQAAALDIAQAYDATTGALNIAQLAKGAVGYGLLGDTKGALGNPLLIGAIGLVLSNPQIISNLLPRTPTT